MDLDNEDHIWHDIQKRIQKFRCLHVSPTSNVSEKTMIEGKAKKDGDSVQTVTEDFQIQIVTLLGQIQTQHYAGQPECL